MQVHIRNIRNHISSPNFLDKLPHMELPSSFLSSLFFTTFLGRGAFGIVLKAVDHNKQTTAVKLMFPGNVNEKERQQILREIKIPKILKKHRNIVQVLEVEERHFSKQEVQAIFKYLDEDDQNSWSSFRSMLVGNAKRRGVNSICIQFELCGENLRKWIDHGQDSSNVLIQRKQINIIQNILAGLKYLHDNKIIHRDLKPENIMFAKDGFTLPVKIGDFGMCRIVHSAESITNGFTSMAGTEHYMAPEALNKDYSYQSDLYALGLIIWEVAQLIKSHERKPFFDTLVNDKNIVIIKEQIFMHGIRELISSLVKRNKDHRIQSVDDVIGLCAHWGSEVEHKIARNGEELREYLKAARPGTCIQLEKGTYYGPFHLYTNNVEIVGEGSDTILKHSQDGKCLTVHGGWCTISNVSVINGIELVCSGTTIRDIEILRGGVTVTGNFNKLENLSIFETSDGIWIYGCNNSVDHVQLSQVSWVGLLFQILLFGKQNIRSNVGIYVAGSNNLLMEVNFTGGHIVSTGVWLFSGSHNIVINLTSSVNEDFFARTLVLLDLRKLFAKLNSTWGLKVTYTNSTIKNSRCGPVLVEGSGTTLQNVDCGDLVRVKRGAVDTNLINCVWRWKKTPNGVVTFAERVFNRIVKYLKRVSRI